MTDPAGHDMDKLALASMIADHLRGRPIRPEELPEGAWRLVASYVAMLDYGTTQASTEDAGLRFMGMAVRARFRARGSDGRELPVLPKILRGAPRVIEVEPTAGSVGEPPPLG